jgi:hypothetical protein
VIQTSLLLLARNRGVEEHIGTGKTRQIVGGPSSVLTDMTQKVFSAIVLAVVFGVPPLVALVG